MRKKIVRVLSAIIVWILNPVVFLTFFGPLLIVVAMRLIESDALKVLGASGTGNPLRDIFDNKAMPGLVDYTAQYYTALLVSVFWVRSCFEKGLVDFALSIARSDNSNQTAEPVPDGWGDIFRLVLTVTGVLLLIYLLWAFLGGSMATSETLKTYVKHTPQLGVLKFPPLESPITWVRIIVGLHGICLVFYKKR